ncbi:NAD-dependent epimerase/dehydratase family protein [Butyrivibrio sp. AE3006]|uniref:NAD-dependent epimerase/dehydratase family protein n=1 Tax=Butyrivibrio sp. AE3006 TaxID=1280673 RepID=UPI0003FB232A|nr:NAD(P)-dependent oxidoreductase [Butyrivibrio sp. AE3006]
MSRIVVTGATSMIGVALIEEAVSQGDEVYALVRNNSSRIDRIPKSDKIHVVECDLGDMGNIEDLGVSCDVFYHFAWNYTDQQGRKDPALQSKNIGTTLEAVELAHRLECHRFVGAGSQAEYGIVEDVISADTIANPQIPYGIAKCAAGKLAQRLCEKYGMEFVWGRIFSVYGRFDNEWTMLNTSIDKFLKGEEANFSAATQMWNYLNEHDAGRIFYLLGTCEGVSGIYCVANPESKRLREYIEEMASLFGNTAKCVFAQEDPDNKPVSLNADVEKLLVDTGFTPRVSFADGIKEVIEYRRNRKV